MSERVTRWLESPRSTAVGFLWGLAEATVFFVIPDVFLSAVAAKGGRSAVHATLAALVGALVGGTAMWLAGQYTPEAALAILEAVPAVDAGMIEAVAQAISDDGALSVVLGPTKGVPYKIYAVQWAIAGGGLPTFLLVSVLARLPRFALAAAVARGLSSFAQRRFGMSLERVLVGVGLFWAAVYAWYWVQHPLW